MSNRVKGSRSKVVQNTNSHRFLVLAGAVRERYFRASLGQLLCTVRIIDRAGSESRPRWYCNVGTSPTRRRRRKHPTYARGELVHPHSSVPTHLKPAFNQ